MSEGQHCRMNEDAHYPNFNMRGTYHRRHDEHERPYEDPPKVLI